MYIQDVHFTLKDGRKAIVRSPMLDDAEGCCHLLHKASKETHFIGRAPEDCEHCDVQWHLEYIRKMNTSRWTYMLVCEVEGKIVATAKMWQQDRVRNSHRGTITLCVLKDYWGQGIGKTMLSALKDAAKTRAMLMQLELTVASTNQRAQKLYESVGFKKVAVHPNAIRLANGNMLDHYFMVCEL